MSAALTLRRASRSRSRYLASWSSTTSTCRIIVRTDELVASSPRVCTASSSGRPARMNAPSWRDRCMTSSRLTRGEDSSTRSIPRFSESRMSRSCRPYRASSAASRLSARCTPVASCPSGPVATYANLTTSAPYNVNGPQHLGEVGHAGFDQTPRLFLERAHTLVPRDLADLVVGGVPQDHLADRVGHRHHLVDADPLQVSGVGAEVAAGPAQEAV